MFTRVVELKGKPGKSKELTNTFTEKVLPILQKQRGFQDEILLLSDTDPDRALGISFWDTKEDAVSVRGSTRLTGLVVESADLPGALADQIKN
jgi:heme-degrading monooxygenase HmoA